MLKATDTVRAVDVALQIVTEAKPEYSNLANIVAKLGTPVTGGYLCNAGRLLAHLDHKDQHRLLTLIHNGVISLS